MFGADKNPELENNIHFEQGSEDSGGKKNNHVLIVEDDETSRIYLEEILESMGLRYVSTKSGEEALEEFRKSNPSLVLLDIRLPDINGADLFKIFRKENTEVRVVAQTAFALENEQREFKKLGFDSYLIKPLQRQLLIDTIKDNLQST